MNIRLVAAAGAVGVLLAVSVNVSAAQAAASVDLQAFEAKGTATGVGDRVTIALPFSLSAAATGVVLKVVPPAQTQVTFLTLNEPRCLPSGDAYTCTYSSRLAAGQHSLRAWFTVRGADVRPGGFALSFADAGAYTDPRPGNNAAAIRLSLPGGPSPSPSAVPSPSPSRKASPVPSPSPTGESPSPESSPTEDLPAETPTGDATSADVLPTAGTNSPDQGVSLLSVVIIGGSIVLVIVGVLLMWLLLRRTDDDDDEGEDFLDTRFGR